MTDVFPFDPTYGYDQESLRAIACPPAPDDFAAFWRDPRAG
jgi:cephalosporin-C deacetylase